MIKNLKIIGTYFILIVKRHFHYFGASAICINNLFTCS